MKKNLFCRLAALALTCALLLGAAPTALAAGDCLTRGEARDMLLAAADDYNPAVTAADILRGDADGALHEDEAVTRAEALVMLSRAFGILNTPVGDSARWAYDSASFTDVPGWAQSELANVFGAGIVAGISATTFSPRDPVTREQMELFIQRVYALQGSNLKDDFYAAVNKEWLDSSTILPGSMINGTLYEITAQTNTQVAQLILGIAASEPEAGSPEEKIKNLYENILDWDARNAAGVTPIQPYLDAIDAAGSLEELMAVHNQIIQETSVALLVGFGLTQDLADTTQRAVAIGSISPSLTEEYFASEPIKALFTQYIATLLLLGGEEDAQALSDAKAYTEVEAALAKAQLSAAQKADISNTYHVVPAQDVAALFPHVDLNAVLSAYGFHPEEAYVITDQGLLAQAAALLTPENLDTLKLVMRVSLLGSLGGALSRDFTDAANALNAALLGTEGTAGDAATAAAAVQLYLSDYLGQAYVERYFSSEAKADVERMIDDILAVYAQRLENLTWMSRETRDKAVEKLSAITVNVGYPDQWDDPYAGVALRSREEGGSYYENLIAMSRASMAAAAAAQDEPVDKTGWLMSAYTVNAYYSATSNSINFPAGILQAPLYDVNADYTENLGGIGYIIAHEITHAFDNNGAQFDAQGNQNNWWTEADYAAFQSLCQDVVDFYDGVESAPGITCNGLLTLSENVADLGALACITQIESASPQPDYAALYRSAARTWRSTASREARMYLAALDVHAADKLRGSRALQSLDEFYQAFDIQPGDGMYLPEELRIQIW